MAEAVAEEDEEEAPQGGARSRIVEAFWSGTFLLIADLKSYEFPLKDMGLFGMSTFPRTTTLGNLGDLHLCNLWILMKLQRLSII